MSSTFWQFVSLYAITPIHSAQLLCTIVIVRSTGQLQSSGSSLVTCQHPGWPVSSITSPDIKYWAKPWDWDVITSPVVHSVSSKHRIGHSPSTQSPPSTISYGPAAISTRG